MIWRVTLDEQRRAHFEDAVARARELDLVEFEEAVGEEDVYEIPLVMVAREFGVTASGLAQKLRRELRWQVETLEETVFNPDLGPAGRFIQVKKLWLQHGQIEAARVLAQEIRWRDDRRNSRTKVRAA